MKPFDKFRFECRPTEYLNIDINEIKVEKTNNDHIVRTRDGKYLASTLLKDVTEWIRKISNFTGVEIENGVYRNITMWGCKDIEEYKTLCVELAYFYDLKEAVEQLISEHEFNQDGNQKEETRGRKSKSREYLHKILKEILIGSPGLLNRCKHNESDEYNQTDFYQLCAEKYKTKFKDPIHPDTFRKHLESPECPKEIQAAFHKVNWRRVRKN